MPSSDLRGFVEASEPGKRCAARAPDLDERPEMESSCEGGRQLCFFYQKETLINAFPGTSLTHTAASDLIHPDFSS
jgi:hypothetical protein